MREILFRGKRVIDGKWVESCCPLGEMHSGTVTYDFDSKTVCQYTGLTDRNGRKIFEGDIVETVCDGEQNPNYVVIWDKGELDFKVTNGEERYKGNYEYLGYCDEIIVIGNIFDNPELLRGA